MKAIFGLLVVAIILVIGWLVFSGGSEPEQDAPATGTEVIARPEASSLGSGIADMRRDEALDGNPILGGAATVVSAGPVNEPEPVAWFRGQLRIVGGELPTPPILTAVVEPGASSDSDERAVRLDPRELSFAVPAHDLAANCRLRLGDIVKAVRVFGPATLDENDLIFSAPADGVIVEVEIRPHAGILFLHDPSSTPLSGAQAGYSVAEDGSSMSSSGPLDADGMMYFDYESLKGVADAKTVTFNVSRLPDIGYSESIAFPVQEFLQMPRPVVLRFAATERLRFRVLDMAKRPIPGAGVRIGVWSSNQSTDAEGWAAVLQSSPPSEEVVAEAAGFITATFPITPQAPTGQDLELKPASSIVLVATEAPPGGWGELRAEFLFTGKPDATSLLPQNFKAGRFTVSSGGYGVTSNGDVLHFLLGTSFSHDGRVVVDGIHVDVPVRVMVKFRGFTILDQRIPLQPGDGENVVKVGSLPLLVPLTGLVEDVTGAPISGVTLLASSDSWELEAVSGADGRFDLGLVAADSRTLVRLACEGYAIQQVEYFAEARDEDSLGRIRLTAGRDFVLQVLCPDGTPFLAPPDWWSPILEVFGKNIRPVKDPATPPGPGAWLFRDVPPGEFMCIVDLFGDAGQHRVDTTIPTSTLTLTAEEFELLSGKK